MIARSDHPSAVEDGPTSAMMADVAGVEIVVAHHQRATVRVGDAFRGVRWLVEHGLDPSAPGCEVDVLRSRMADQ